MPCNVDAVTSPRYTREPLSLSLHYIGSFLRFHQQVEHNASLFQYVSLHSLQNAVAKVVKICRLAAILYKKVLIFM